MLHHLQVQNLALLKDAAIDPAAGFTVITGETGAGKTLVLGGLRLVLGERADPAAVGPWGGEILVEGLLEADSEEITVTRVVPRDGRSRARLDGELVTIGTLASSLSGLVDIVSQHSHLMLRSRSQLLDLVDGSLEESGRSALGDYRAAWEELKEVLARREVLGGDSAVLHRELDLLRYQVAEITAANLELGEDESLEAEAQRLRNVEAIAELLADSLRITERMSEDSGELVARLRKVAHLDPTAQELPDDGEELVALLSELSTRVRNQVEGLESDPRRANEVEERLNLIGEMKRKYGRTVADVLAFGEQAQRRLEEVEELVAAAAGIEAAVERARAAVEEAGARLGEARRRAADRIVEAAMGHLHDLAMPDARIAFEFTTAEAGSRGTDRVQLLFSSDPRLAPGPVAGVASGGELSRLALAMGLATRSATTPTLVFDEVDAGIGGATALEMGRKLAALAQHVQVLCVTHLPQIAAYADRHYVVSRSDGAAAVMRVEGEERVTEIARMLAGLPGSQAGQEAAAELMAEARFRQ
ncbi:MAG: DNA repair protein RecN [Acidimicrobiia bacterium]